MTYITAGELKKCLENIPDEAEVGFQLAGYGPDGYLIVTDKEGINRGLPIIRRTVSWLPYGYKSVDYSYRK